jgi:hypothetical protein
MMHIQTHVKHSLTQHLFITTHIQRHVPVMLSHDADRGL